MCSSWYFIVMFSGLGCFSFSDGDNVFVDSLSLILHDIIFE